MHKDPLYQNRCAPYSDPKFSLFWDKIHMKILELEEKLELFKNWNFGIFYIQELGAIRVAPMLKTRLHGW